MTRSRIHFTASDTPVAQEGLGMLAARYGNLPLDQAEVVVALGGDGFMLQTLHATENMDIPVYGMNRGTVGFFAVTGSGVLFASAIITASAELPWNGNAPVNVVYTTQPSANKSAR